ncbi:MAG TPA: DUF1257 domain-containing protein [Chloroflexota bacterium]|nr:DUF1257 domain-containing protein [Chloroflexota bacterium]
MSKYLTFPDVAFKDRRLLLAALTDVGFPIVEEGKALPLCGYQGDRRPETAEIVIRRQHIGRASNDVGFARTPEGYVPIVSDFDRRTLLNGAFLTRLRTAYSEQVVQEVRRRVHGTAIRRVEGQTIQITVRY